jgi:hypothetical protein
MPAEFARRCTSTFLALGLFAALSWVPLAAASYSAAAAPPPKTLFGTLDTQISSVGTESRAGLSVGMFELDWASLEPKPGVFSNSWMSGFQHFLWKYREEKMRVTLGLGLNDPPQWVFSLPDSSYVNQFGQVSREADMVFSEPVRQAAEGYLKYVAAHLSLRSVWAVRLSSGGDDEMLYPAGGTFWAFENSALNGTHLPPTMARDPFPNWRPGTPGLSPAQIDTWVNWYIRGLDDVTAWQVHVLSGLGFTGTYQLVTPGSGTRPDVLSQVEHLNLPNDGTTGVGAVWDRYYSMLPDKTNVVAYVSSVADESGGDDSCQAGDDLIPLTSPEMDSWSATRWISRVAAANLLQVAGENSGYQMPSALNGHYLDRSSHGMMADAIRQATSCHFQVFYWAHDVNLWDGTLPFSLYLNDIASAGR